jgi:hypothetical protein
LLQIFRDLEGYEQYRQYKQIYSILSNDKKEKLSETEYLTKKNEWRDKIVDQSSYHYFKINIKRETLNKTSTKSIKVTITYQWSKDEKEWDEYERQITFVQEQNEWKLNDLLIFEMI